ncbi:hypothetical protein FKP32DRAFT_4033 [Trametes sanguinea]|nr:hypothetical protein FKP32DRAFT_4033 [Trametes sanguinea]
MWSEDKTPVTMLTHVRARYHYSLQYPEVVLNIVADSVRTLYALGWLARQALTEQRAPFEPPSANANAEARISKGLFTTNVSDYAPHCQITILSRSRFCLSSRMMASIDLRDSV